MNTAARALVLVMLLLCTGHVSEAAGLRLAPLFTDSMVVQQQTRVSFWGTGMPGRQITVRGSWGRTASVTVNRQGAWELLLPTPRAGGPYEVEVSDGDSVHLLRNVLAGEVWLCSGQSNMEMPLGGWPPSDTVAGSAAEIHGAANPSLRLFTVSRSCSPTPLAGCEGRWVQAGPAALARFSATGYFFARKLQKELHVPVGLILSSWGGTPIEAWMDSAALADVPGMDTTIGKLGLAREGFEKLTRWFAGMPKVDMRETEGEGRWGGLRFDDDSCGACVYDDSRWKSLRLPGLWESSWMEDFDGAVWLRRTVVIPASWKQKDLVLHLGPIDDMDETFVNGTRVGATEGEGMWKVVRRYSVPGELVRDSVVQIAVRVLDTGGGGGIWGGKGSMFLSPAGAADSSVSLEGEWKCLPVAEYREGVFYVIGARGERYYERPVIPVGVTPHTPTTLFNGMMAPVAPFGIRGAIWYQGESNVEQPALYERLFPRMIDNWRRVFHSPSMPFYYVQIAPFTYDMPSQFLREAQLKTLAVAGTGMAVTLDIGNPLNIHPANKRAVGDRLARWALVKTYGKKIPFSGPVPRSVKFRRGVAELTFDHAGKSLVLLQGPVSNGFQIAGADSVFRDAEVVVRGNVLLVSHPDVDRPLAVRYAFSNTPEATLFNSDGLPASSFRTDSWAR